MKIDRRRLLASVAAGSAAALLPWRPAVASSPGDPGTRAEAAAPLPLTSLQGSVSWQRVRAEFDLDPGWIHLGGFYLVSHPRTVRDAVCLLYTSPSPRDRTRSRMPSSA